jgi:type III pantothenate kinase
VDGMAQRLIADVEPRPTVVATGPDAPLLVPHCSMVDAVDELLTLKGMAILWQRDQSR